MSDSNNREGGGDGSRSYNTWRLSRRNDDDNDYYQAWAYNDGDNLIGNLPTLALNAAVELEENTGAPWPLILSCLLGAMSIAVQPLYNVCFKEGRNPVPCSLYLVTLAESGEGKTSVSVPVMKTFERHDEEAEALFSEQMGIFRSKLRIWSAKNKAYERKLQKQIEKGEPTDETEALLSEHEAIEPEKPRSLRIIFSDVTPDKFVYELRGEGRCAALVADEGGELFKGRILNDLAAMNKYWDGDGSRPVDRKSVDSFIVKDPRVTMSAFVQPKVFESYLERCKKNQDAPMESGFLPRCLITKVKSRKGMQRERVSEVIWNHTDRFSERVTTLLKRYTTRSDCEKQILTLSSEAGVKLSMYEQFINNSMKEGARYSVIAEVAKRATNNAARLAAIFHVFDEHAEGNVIGFEHMNRATNISHAYLEQTRNIFYDEAEICDDADYLADWLLTRRHRFPFSFSEIRKGTQRHFGTKKRTGKDRLRQAMDLLIREGKYLQRFEGLRREMIYLLWSPR